MLMLSKFKERRIMFYISIIFIVLAIIFVACFITIRKWMQFIRGWI